MSTQAETQHGGAAQGQAEAGTPSEEELRAAYEAELSRITSADMVLQAAASLLNIGAYRLGLTGTPDPAAVPQRDLEQVRDAIDAVRGLLPVIERSRPQELRSLRDALSHLQVAYAREAQGASSEAAAATGAEQPTPAAGTPGQQPPATGTSGQSAPATGQTSDAGQSPPPASPATDPATGGKSGPGPAEASGRLWVPGR